MNIRPRKLLRASYTALLHALLLTFFLDVLAQVWPWFGSFWHGQDARFVVGAVALIEHVGHSLIVVEVWNRWRVRMRLRHYQRHAIHPTV